jgi:hypothetical protein
MKARNIDLKELEEASRISDSLRKQSPPVGILQRKLGNGETAEKGSNYRRCLGSCKMVCRGKIHEERSEDERRLRKGNYRYLVHLN